MNEIAVELDRTSPPMPQPANPITRQRNAVDYSLREGVTPLASFRFESPYFHYDIDRYALVSRREG
jgi:hypothetical protein